MGDECCVMSHESIAVRVVENVAEWVDGMTLMTLICMEEKNSRDHLSLPPKKVPPHFLKAVPFPLGPSFIFC